MHVLRGLGETSAGFVGDARMVPEERVRVEAFDEVADAELAEGSPKDVEPAGALVGTVVGAGS